MTRTQGVVLLIVGVALAVVAIAGSRQALDARRQGERDVTVLRLRLDSARAVLARAPAAESARIATEVREREYWLGRREYHLARPAPSGAPWRRPYGPWTVMLGAGVALVLLGAGIVVRVATRPLERGPA